MRGTRKVLVALTLGSWLLSAASAHAAPVHPGRKAVAGHEALGPEDHARRLKLSLTELAGSDPAAIRAALENLRALKGRAAAEAIAERVAGGLPPALTEPALEILGELNQPVVAPVLSELALHRRWQIRAKAVAALGALRVRSRVSVLLYALDDPSAEVRSAAARALGQLGDPRTRAALNTAYERGVDGALEGLAQLATSAQVDAVLEKASVDLNASEPALWTLLTRKNLTPVTKLKVITLLATSSSAASLARFRARLAEAGELRLVTSIDQQTAKAQKTPPGKQTLPPEPVPDESTRAAMATVQPAAGTGSEQ